jgi:HEAT repeat protein
MKTSQLIFLALILSASPVHSAIPKKTDIKGNLKKDFTFQELEQMSFDTNLPLKNRWTAIMSLTLKDKYKSQRVLERAIKSPDWFMRDAGLLAMETVDSKRALALARKLLKDPALVVRTRAAKIFKRHGELQDQGLLWEELENQRNYRNGQSLWVRRHIVQALAKVSDQSHVYQFIRLLDDSDVRVSQSAVMVLETLTGQKLGGRTEPHTHKVSYWKKWFSAQAKI